MRESGAVATQFHIPEAIEPYSSEVVNAERKMVLGKKSGPDSILDKACAIAGTPEECIQRIEEYRQAGCTNIMLEIWGDNREEQARLFGEAVLPHFRKYGVGSGR